MRVNRQQYKSLIENRTVSDNGIVSVNMHIEQIEQLEKQGMKLPLQAFDYIVYLWRRNRLRQAYSLAKAAQPINGRPRQRSFAS